MMKLSWMVPCVLCALLAGCGDGAKDATAAEGAAAAEKGGQTTAEEPVEVRFAARMKQAVDAVEKRDAVASEEATRAACELRPESAEALLLAGHAAYLKKDYKRAGKAFRAVALEKDLPAKLRSEAWAGCGVAEMAQQAGEVARVSFLQALRLDRRNPVACYHLGLLYRDTFRFTEAALEQFQMASHFLDARDPRAQRLSRDIIPSLSEECRKAAAARPGVTKRDPGAAAKLLEEGEKLLARKRPREAIRKFEAALKADPLSETAAFKCGETIEKFDKSAAGVEKALEAYRIARELRPQRQSYYQAAARLAYERRRWALTVQIMDRAMAHDPASRPALDLLIASLRKAGKMAEAEAWEAYRKVL